MNVRGAHLHVWAIASEDKARCPGMLETMSGANRSPGRYSMHEPLGEVVEEVPPSFDEGSIASAFDALLSDAPMVSSGRMSVDLTPVRELFAALAANHVRHVRDFMIDVKWGDAARDWTGVCLPAVSSLRRAATHLELGDLVVRLDAFADILAALNDMGAPRLEDEEKAVLLEKYEALSELMPQAFALDQDRSQREAVIVQALLLQVPDVWKVTIDKLHAAGLSSLSALFSASADEIAHVAGIQETLAERIVTRVRAYRDEVMRASPNDARAAEREQLAKLLGTLREEHEAHEVASVGWSSESKTKKRETFRAREEAWLAIRVLLARFGEVDKLSGIEKVPFAKRIELLNGVLADTYEKYRLE